MISRKKIKIKKIYFKENKKFVEKGEIELKRKINFLRN